jgi:hypothetical protein
LGGRHAVWQFSPLVVCVRHPVAQRGAEASIPSRDYDGRYQDFSRRQFPRENAGPLRRRWDKNTIQDYQISYSLNCPGFALDLHVRSLTHKELRLTKIVRGAARKEIDS